MTERANIATRTRRTTGDIVVDGLLSGMAAGVVMATLLVVLGLLDGVGPAALLGRFDPAGDSSPLTGALMHVAMSGLYGVALALVLRLLARRGLAWRRYGWLLGAAYGIVLWIVARFWLSSGLGTGLMDIPTLQLLTAHVVYGVVLGYVLARHQPA